MSKQDIKPGRSMLKVADDAPDYPTILHALQAAAERIPERTALICDESSITYGEHAKAAAGLARRLERIGVEGERVAVLMSNSIEMPVCILGSMAAHGYVAPMNPNYSDRELETLLADAAPKVLLTQPDREDRARKFGRLLSIPHVIVAGAGDETLEHWIAEGASGFPRPLPQPDDDAMMFFTGGTTGVPKGAEHRHRTIMAFCRIESAFYTAAEYDKEVSLSVAPMFHIFGHHHAVIHPIYLGATHVVVRQYKPEIVLDRISKHGVTVFAGGPSTVYTGLLANAAIKTARLSQLKICLAGAAPCSEDLLRNWARVAGCDITEGVGMSEGAPYANNPSRGKKKLLSVGLVPPETEIDIVDLETGDRVLPVGETGEIRVRGPQMSRSYRNRPEETARTMRDGWVYTGDIGYFDEEGYLFLIDRKKELILSGGYNIYPREIDEVLNSHPDTLEVATVGVPDSFRGEVPKAFVVLKPGRNVSAEDLLAYCAERLVDYKVPRFIEFMDSLPKTGPGKFDKLKLRGLR